MSNYICHECGCTWIDTGHNHFKTLDFVQCSESFTKLKEKYDKLEQKYKKLRKKYNNLYQRHENARHLLKIAIINGEIDEQNV